MSASCGKCAIDSRHVECGRERSAWEDHISTGENINANGGVLTAAMVREGFFRFPQTVLVKISPSYFAAIAPIQIAAGYPFNAMSAAEIPPGQLWFLGQSNELLGRIVNIGL